MEAATAVRTSGKTPEERKQMLARAVANEVRQGGRIESQSDFQAVIVKGSKTNHVLHLILTLLTASLWAVVWVALAIFGGEKRTVVDVDEYGNTNIQR